MCMIVHCKMFWLLMTCMQYNLDYGGCMNMAICDGLSGCYWVLSTRSHVSSCSHHTTQISTNAPYCNKVKLFVHFIKFLSSKYQVTRCVCETQMPQIMVNSKDGKVHKDRYLDTTRKMFHMSIPSDKAFPWVPTFSIQWPWPCSLAYCGKI